MVLFQFIDSRLELLNKGKDPDDLFEALIKHHNTTGMFWFGISALFLWKFNQQLCLYVIGRGKSCQQLVGNLKVSISQELEVALSCLAVRYNKMYGFFFWQKGGGSLIHNMKTKANVRVDLLLRGTYQRANCCNSRVYHCLLQAKWLTTSSVKNLLVHKVRSCMFISADMSPLFCTAHFFLWCMQRNHNDPAIHRGGSVSHHRGQSECLQSRLPITQHFGRVRTQNYPTAVLL